MRISCRWGAPCGRPNFATSSPSLVCLVIVLKYSEEEIFHSAASIWVSLGSNWHEVAMSINALLDSGADRALHMLKNITATKPMQESEVNELEIQAIEYLFEDLVSTSV